MSVKSVSARFQFAVLGVALFQALAIAGFVADTRSQSNFIEQGRTVASSSSEARLSKGTSVLVVKNQATAFGRVMDALDDGRFLVRNLELGEDGVIGHTRVLERDEFLLTVGSVDGLRIGDRVQLKSGERGGITRFFQKGFIEVGALIVQRDDIVAPAAVSN